MRKEVMRHYNLNPWRFILSGLIVMASAVSAFAAEPVITQQKAADINGVVISMKDLNSEFRQVLKQRNASENDIAPEQTLEYKKGLLDSMIDQELLYQESKKKKIVVEDKAVVDSVEKVKKSFGTEEAYQNALKDANIQVDVLKERIRRSLAIRKLVDEQIGPNIVVTEDETKQYYDTHPDAFKEAEQVRASHILVKVEKEDGEAKKVAAKEKITAIQKKIKDGQDFAKLARENSDCPSKDEGGDLGYFKKGAMVKEFEDAAFALTPGMISDIVETKFGYHLIKVTDKKEAATISYDNVKGELQAFLKNQKQSKEISTLLETLRKDAKITRYL